MFASITTATVAPERVDELPGIYERLLPTLEAARGWQGIFLVVNRATGIGHLLGLWETESDAHEFESSGAFQRILADYPPGLLVGPPERTVGEVLFHAARGEGLHRS